MSPIWIRWRVSLSLWPLKGETPESMRYVMIPMDHMSEAKVAPSPFTISGATNSGCPYSILTTPTILFEREKSQILISSPPGLVNRMSQGVSERWPMLLECIYSIPWSTWLIILAISISVMYFSEVTTSSSSPPVASSVIRVIWSLESYTSTRRMSLGWWSTFIISNSFIIHDLYWVPCIILAAKLPPVNLYGIMASSWVGASLFLTDLWSHQYLDSASSMV